MIRPSLRPHRDGFSLVLSLIVLTLLSIVVVSFISTTSLERTTARAFSNKSTAEAAAEIGANQAMALLAEKIAQYPDSATVWEPFPTPSAVPAEGTLLYLSDPPTSTNPVRRVLPLVSCPSTAAGPAGTPQTDLQTEVILSAKATAFGKDAWTAENSIDLNRPRSNNDKVGWIGATRDDSDSKKRIQCRARWMHITGTAAAGKTPPIIGRYAFWIEDESFKVNINMLRDFSVGRTTELDETKRNASRSKSETIMAPENIPLQGLMRNLQVTDTSRRDQYAAKAFQLRDSWVERRLFDLSLYNYATPALLIGDKAKFLATVYSGGLNLSRNGTQRVNLNSVLGMDNVADYPYAPDAANTAWKQYMTKNGTAAVQKQVEQIYETIKFHAPQFGQRFYRSETADKNLGAVTAAHQDIYCYKVAANIRDFIDPDLQPTILNAPKGGGARPTVAVPPTVPTDVYAINSNPSGASDIYAQGKESGLYIQEAAVRYRTSVDDKKKWSLQCDYYVEVWNMGAKDIYATEQVGIAEPHALAPGAFLKISNQQAWKASSSGSSLRADPIGSDSPIQGPARDIVIDLTSGISVNGAISPKGVVFKAGECTVITTDPDYNTTPLSGGTSPAFSGGYNKPNIYYCPSLRTTTLNRGKRVYSGTLTKTSDTGIQPDFRDGGEDYDTEVILGTNAGIIDSHPSCIAMGGASKVTAVGTPRDDWYGGTLLGNGTTPSQLGDPRTNNEQMRYTRFISGASTGQPDQSRYFNTVGAPRFSLGFPNDLYVNPQLPNAWPDYYKGWVKTSTNTATNPNKETAPARVSDWRLESIGQLGDVYDPARIISPRGSLGAEGSRGGGRTFRIGQKDDLVDSAKYTNPSMRWASWRLADMFSTTSSVYLPGVININGVRRDNGAAIRAACYDIVLHLVGQDAAAINPTISDTKVVSDESAAATQASLMRMIDQMITRLKETDPTKSSYFAERGELSELAIFSSTSANPADQLVSTTRMGNAFDHSREELLRRLLEMITTRGNIFTVYAVGQSVTQSNDANKTLRVTGEHWTKTTFALVPKNSDGSPFGFAREDFDPNSSASRTARFATPHHYDIQLLKVESL